ncbi:MAG: adenylate/guanylate cyclase domain-containing protein [Pseudanabaenaceae cyanobacterium bins.68]|nr:adenylate/guanylate cyclase domain-containing protein [Pseudanabaenaceae cyanobacterium bins.68]
MYSSGTNNPVEALASELAVTRPNLKPYLLLKNGKESRQINLHQESPWTIGRGSDTSCQIPDPCASRNHALIQELEPGNYYLIDLGSRNGTILNGKRISFPVALNNGDQITIGESSIQFCCPSFKTAGEQVRMDEQITDTMLLHRRRLITVLVVDIRDFTKLSQQIEDRLLSELIGTWFRRAGQIISDHGSWVDKYIGDAVMAVWIHNTLPELEHIPTKEMLLAFQALQQLSLMTEQLNQHFKLPFKLRVGAGMNTGYAMVGQMGSSRHTEYTALGDTVNAAFRFESATKQVGVDIILGQGTYTHTPYAAVLLPFRQYLVNLKGYSEQVLSYGGTFAQLEEFLSKIRVQEQS